MSITNITNNYSTIEVDKSSNPIVLHSNDIELLYMNNEKITVGDLSTISLKELDTKPLSDFI